MDLGALLGLTARIWVAGFRPALFPCRLLQPCTPGAITKSRSVQPEEPEVLHIVLGEATWITRLMASFICAKAKKVQRKVNVQAPPNY